MWDISKIKIDALKQTNWDEELEKYKLWDTDIERAEHFTEEEEESYKRVMQRLGA